MWCPLNNRLVKASHINKPPKKCMTLGLFRSEKLVYFVFNCMCLNPLLSKNAISSKYRITQTNIRILSQGNSKSNNHLWSWSFTQQFFNPRAECSLQETKMPLDFLLSLKNHWDHLWKPRKRFVWSIYMKRKVTIMNLL